MSNFARRVSGFGVTQGGKPLAWDKTDPDTWRIRPTGRGEVTITFDFLANQLDNAMAWSAPEFLMVNGTNVFLYPEGRSLDFPAKVSVTTESGWRVATGMTPDAGARSWKAGNYHDLVDMPFFIGKFDFDSTQVAGKWIRLASYPAGTLAGAQRAEFWSQLSKYLPVEIAVFQVAPYATYTNLLIFDEDFGGGSALEHQNSHVGIYTPLLIGNPVLPSITAHEIFHLWNVKRLRPAAMVPYAYDHWMPTPWLWVSEGITDYYADLALVRAGVIDSAEFLALTAGKMQEVADVPVGVAGGRLDFRVDRHERRHRLHLLPQGLARRDAARHPDPRGERQPPLARRRDARACIARPTRRAGGSPRRSGGTPCRWPRAGRPSPTSTRATSTGASRSPTPRCSRSPGSRRWWTATGWPASASRPTPTPTRPRCRGSPRAARSRWPAARRATSWCGSASSTRTPRAGPSSSGPSTAPRPKERSSRSSCSARGSRVTLQMPLRFVTLRSYRLVFDPKASPEAARIRTGILAGMVNQ